MGSRIYTGFSGWAGLTVTRTHALLPLFYTGTPSRPACLLCQWEGYREDSQMAHLPEAP